MKAGRVFNGFREGDIQHPPTFKMERGKHLDYDKERSPAWCDRVLWRTMAGFDGIPVFEMKQTGLGCALDITTSDHKPVWATFDLPVSGCNSYV